MKVKEFALALFLKRLILDYNRTMYCIGNLVKELLKISQGISYNKISITSECNSKHSKYKFTKRKPINAILVKYVGT